MNTYMYLLHSDPVAPMLYNKFIQTRTHTFTQPWALSWPANWVHLACSDVCQELQPGHRCQPHGRVPPWTGGENGGMYSWKSDKGGQNGVWQTKYGGWGTTCFEVVSMIFLTPERNHVKILFESQVAPWLLSVWSISFSLGSDNHYTEMFVAYV